MGPAQGDKLADPTYDWETRGVGDGRYEIKVEATDAAYNPSGQGKTSSRVSDPIVVDNTAPLIGDIRTNIAGCRCEDPLAECRGSDQHCGKTGI